MVIPSLIIILQSVNLLVASLYGTYSASFTVIQILIILTMIRALVETFVSAEQQQRSILWRNWQYLRLPEVFPKFLYYGLAVLLIGILIVVSYLYQTPLTGILDSTLLLILLQFTRPKVDYNSGKHGY